eukprot:gnl/TRDRNA2_/TRDRNA2_162348_c1_seq1.p1 gnl/TRDRNA2_/TRDRNA2_162348_c1~~gnl/TRDRNA2_/TRDRNA2_162348_c1_seq1.p1  ORF type:complete len:142 (-),score=3.21 gnl/TRDRNA2_/TRDRNA2_162348_c1_seq1:288-713(-)
MGFRIGVDSHMALVQVRHHRVRQRPGRFFVPVGTARRGFVFRDQHGHTGALRIVVLTGHVEDVGANDARHVGEDFSQPLRVVELIDVLDVLLAVLLGLRIGDVENIEAERLGQVVETVHRNLGIGIFYHRISPLAVVTARG